MTTKKHAQDLKPLIKLMQSYYKYNNYFRIGIARYLDYRSQNCRGYKKGADNLSVFVRQGTT